MSLGTGGQYRRQALRAAGLGGACVYSMSRRVLASFCARPRIDRWHRGLAIGLDPSRGMLRECRKHCAAPLVQARGEACRFASEHFDMVSMGYGLRHVADLQALFRRVPARPQTRRTRADPRDHTARIEGRPPPERIAARQADPRGGPLVEGRRGAQMMDYFWDTVKNCVPPDAILSALRDAGFPGRLERSQAAY